MTAAALARGTTCEVGGTRAFATPVNSGGSSLNELLTEMRMQREEQLLIMVPILGNRFFMLACLQAARLLGPAKGERGGWQELGTWQPHRDALAGAPTA